MREAAARLLTVAAVIAVSAPALAAIGATAGRAAALAPHRAVYDITLVTARPGAGISELTGRMVYELTGSSCDGYTQNMRFVTRTTNQEGAVSINDLRSTSWEDAAASRFRFSSSQFRNDQATEQTAGEAVRRKGAGDVKVELSRPRKKVVSLPAGVMFPVQHSSELLEAARRGDRTFAADLFDASEKGEKVHATNAFIGARLDPGYNRTLSPVVSAAPLDELPAWPVALSYFERGKEREDAVPSYELAFVFFDNGVSRRILIDYGDFSVRGTLKDLVFVEPGKCDPARK